MICIHNIAMLDPIAFIGDRIFFVYGSILQGIPLMSIPADAAV